MQNKLRSGSRSGTDIAHQFWGCALMFGTQFAVSVTIHRCNFDDPLERLAQLLPFGSKRLAVAAPRAHREGIVSVITSQAYLLDVTK